MNFLSASEFARMDLATRWQEQLLEMQRQLEQSIERIRMAAPSVTIPQISSLDSLAKLQFSGAEQIRKSVESITNSISATHFSAYEQIKKSLEDSFGGSSTLKMIQEALEQTTVRLPQLKLDPPVMPRTPPLYFKRLLEEKPKPKIGFVDTDKQGRTKKPK